VLDPYIEQSHLCEIKARLRMMHKTISASGSSSRPRKAAE